MTPSIRNSTAALALASLLVGAGCANSETVAPQKDPVPIEVIDGSALPSAATLTGHFPTTPGIDEFTPEPEAPPREQPDPSPTCRGFRVTDLLFASGNHELQSEGRAAIAAFSTGIPEEATIEITGHTDDLPIAMGNQRLSELRAESVATTLENHLNVGQRIVDVRGAADRDPIDDNTTETGRQANRRVEILINCGSES